MTASAVETKPAAVSRGMALPSARRLLLWTGLAVLIAWVLVPIYLVALGAFGGGSACSAGRNRSGPRTCPSRP